MIRKFFLLTIFLFSWVFSFGQIEELPVKVINGTSYYYYEVPPKATIYSITRTYGISREELLKYNPQIIDGLRAGDTLLFPMKNNVPTEEPVKESKEVSDTVIPAAIIEPAKSIKQKQQIQPVQPIEQKEPTDTISQLKSTEVEREEKDDDEIESISIGVMLPFMLESEAVTRQAQNNMAFYRGMLLAIDALSTPEKGTVVHTFDTESSNDVIKRIMSRPEVQALDYIIAPGDSLAIEIIAETADTTGATVINLFAVKNDAHLHHESVLQGNITHDAMYTRAIGALCKMLESKKVLILNATDIPADKIAFTEEFADAMIRTGIPYEQINYAGKLTAENLQALDPRDYVCIPTSSSREALLKILPAVTDFADANPGMEVDLIGYPEWVVLRGEIKDKLHKLNATVYSRFSTDLDGADVATVNSAYNRWYGEAPQQSLPDVMLLGYDTVAWLLNGVDKAYTGLQNSFKITDIDGAGQVNEGLYLINFTRSGRIDARAL